MRRWFVQHAARLFWVCVVALFLINLCYAVWSFGLTDPNLVYSSQPLFWSFQQWAWNTFFHNPQVNTWVYSILVLASFLWYGLLVLSAAAGGAPRQGKQFWMKVAVAFVVVSSPLILANTALSHDIFNYIFNARMVVEYQANPHLKTALDFAFDPWTRFMHNTHTTAPYWYGWTGLSLLPYLAGMKVFLLTWIQFKLWAWLSFVLLLVVYAAADLRLSVKLNRKVVLLVVFNPLLLIEILGNGHNDLWMMLPVILSFVLVWRKQLSYKVILLSLLLLLLSVSTKYATIVLLPMWLVLVAGKVSSRSLWFTKQGVSAQYNQAALAALLLLNRSQRFLPWYLAWSFVWLPFLTTANSWLIWLRRVSIALVVGFSVSGLFRYVPWLLTAQYTTASLATEKQIVWLGGLAVSLIIGTSWYLWEKVS